MTYKGIIFDFDGVILESMDIKTDAFSYLFRNYPKDIIEKVEPTANEDGLEMIRRVREASGNAPVIVMAGYASLNAVIRAIRDDACDYLVNPLDDPDAILAAVESGLLERKGMLESV